MDSGYLWKNTTPYIQVTDPAKTTQNVWKGSITQESASLFTLTDATSYGGNGFTSFGARFPLSPDLDLFLLRAVRAQVSNTILDLTAG